MSNQKTSKATLKYTSSPESVGGRQPFVSPSGPTTDLFGQALAPAKTSPVPVKEKATAVRVISGPQCSGSSASVALSASLASRLKRQLGTGGSTEYRQTWKERATPSGRLYWAHIASKLPTDDNACFGWPTPQTHDTQERGNTNADHHHFPHDLSNAAAELAPWPTPKAEDSEQTGPHRGVMDTLSSASKAAWGTPRVPTNNGTGSLSRASDGMARLEDQVMRAAWVSPTGVPLDQMAAWATPTDQDSANDAGPSQFQRNSLPLNCEAHLASGLPLNGSSAKMLSRGALNPAFSLWLMGFLTGNKTPSWDTASPNWKDWVIAQRLLADYSRGRETIASCD